MLFTEVRFLFFFVMVFCVFWTLRTNRTRKGWLLACSYAFYAGWDWRFLGLIFASTVIDYLCGIRIAAAPDKRGKKPWLMLSLFSNVGLLGFFKYFNWFIESANGFLEFLGLPTAMSTLDIVLPVGISFYTFQTISYTIDLYRDEVKPVRSFWNFALFVSFFPQLVAGPIVRAKEFLPQLKSSRTLHDIHWRRCMTQFLFGYIKKAIVADNFAMTVDMMFNEGADPTRFEPLSLWLGLSMYTVQLYCDFSGYTDMAIASAGMLGYQLPRNFNFPLFANGVTNTWQRWHISVSLWFRDYLYIPLGGNRVTEWKIYRNLYTVFVTCGLWHGANWNFIVFGVWTGSWMILERWLGWKGTDRNNLFRWAYSLGVWLVGLVIFRTQTLNTGWLYWKGMFGGAPEGGGTETLDQAWWFAIVGFFAVHFVMFRRWLHEPFSRLPTWAFCLLIGAAFALLFPFGPGNYVPFIYFQF